MDYLSYFDVVTLLLPVYFTFLNFVLWRCTDEMLSSGSELGTSLHMAWYTYHTAAVGLMCNTVHSCYCSVGTATGVGNVLSYILIDWQTDGQTPRGTVLQNLFVADLAKKYPRFMESLGSLHYLKEPATW